MIRDFAELVAELQAEHGQEEFSWTLATYVALRIYCLYLEWTVVKAVKSVLLFPVVQWVCFLFGISFYWFRFIAGF